LHKSIQKEKSSHWCSAESLVECHAKFPLPSLASSLRGASLVRGAGWLRIIDAAVLLDAFCSMADGSESCERASQLLPECVQLVLRAHQSLACNDVQASRIAAFRQLLA